MGDKVKGIFEFGFDLPDEGFYILKVDDVEVAPADNGGMTYKVISQIDGGAFDGQKHWENFSTRTKKHFGIRKMVGFLIKCGKMNEDAEVDTDMVETDGFKKEFIKMTKGVKYGAYLSHRTWTDKEGKEKNTTQSDKYMTVAEVREKWDEAGKGAPTIAKEKPEPNKQESTKSSVWR